MMVTPGRRTSPSGSRRKPARPYMARAVAIHSVVCRAMRRLPAARARFRQAWNRAWPMPRPRAGGSTARSRNMASSGRHCIDPGARYRVTVPTTRPSSTATSSTPWAARAAASAISTRYRAQEVVNGSSGSAGANSALAATVTRPAAATSSAVRASRISSGTGSVGHVEEVIALGVVPFHVDDALGRGRLDELEEAGVAEVLLGPLGVAFRHLVLDPGQGALILLPLEVQQGLAEHVEGLVGLARVGEVDRRVAGGLALVQGDDAVALGLGQKLPEGPEPVVGLGEGRVLAQQGALERGGQHRLGAALLQPGQGLGQLALQLLEVPLPGRGGAVVLAGLGGPPRRPGGAGGAVAAPPAALGDQLADPGQAVVEQELVAGRGEQA